MSKVRRLPRPWRIEEVSGECLCLVAANGTHVAYIYHAEKSRAAASGRFETHEAWVVARGLLKRVNEDETDDET